MSNDQMFPKYLSEAMEEPFLSRKEELALFERLRAGDEKVCTRILKSHFKFVMKHAAPTARKRKIPVDDLFQVGCMGLMQAIDRFNSQKGARFSTYASFWIKSAIQEYVSKNINVIRIGGLNVNRRLQTPILDLKRRTNQTGELIPEQIEMLAQQHKCREEDIVAVNLALSNPVWSLNHPVLEDTQGSTEFQDTLVDPKPLPEEVIVEKDITQQRKEIFRQAMNEVLKGRREWDIFIHRKLVEEKTTLDALGAEYGVTGERIRQIERKAFIKVQKRALAMCEEKGINLSFEMTS